jgi:hypothetical protein
MLFTRSVYIGVDPSGGKRAIGYAAIDNNLKLLALGRGNLDEVLAFLGGQQEVIVAINSPIRLNQGVLTKTILPEHITPSTRGRRKEDCRLVEQMLNQRGIRIYQTPSQEIDCRPWMRMGFEIYRRLGDIGYKPHTSDENKKQFIEASPLVCYSVWLKRLPFAKRSLEGRLQRQLLLYDFGVDVPDPMRFFEEITRFRVLRGNLPTDILFSSAELEALGIAYAAWLSVNHPDETINIGDQQEGQLLVPVEELQENYRV